LNFEKLGENNFEVIVDESFVVLVSVIAWHFSSAERATLLIIHVFTHALNAESVSAWKQAAFNHKVHTDRAIGHRIFIFFEIVFV
jgi:hypothetical protein